MALMVLIISKSIYRGSCGSDVEPDINFVTFQIPEGAQASLALMVLIISKCLYRGFWG